MKRQMLVATNQIGKAIDEARAMVEAAPYEAQHHVVLADLYGLDGKDSLALAEYGRALQIDSTNVQTLMSLADFHTGRQDYRARCWPSPGNCFSRTPCRSKRRSSASNNSPPTRASTVNTISS